jgi:hypothetical protein
MPAGAATGAVAACAAVAEDRGDADGAGPADGAVAPPQPARIAAASSPPHAVTNDFIKLT